MWAGEKSQAVLVVFDKKGGKDTKLLIESIFLLFYIRCLSLGFTLIKILSTEYFDAGTQAWEFFGLRNWNLYFFVVSYAEMLRFRLKQVFVGLLLGKKGLFCVYWDYAEWKIFCKLGKIFLLFLKSQISPLYLLIIVFPTFDPLTATVMALYCKMSNLI